MSGNTRKNQVTRLVTLRHQSTMSGVLEVRNMEVARSEPVRAVRRGDRDGNAAHSARRAGAGAVRPMCGPCRSGAQVLTEA